MKLATAERKTHWSDMNAGALDFALHDNHVLNASVFMRPLGRVGVYRVLLYNLYNGVQAPYVPNIIIITSDMQGMVWGEPELPNCSCYSAGFVLVLCNRLC